VFDVVKQTLAQEVILSYPNYGTVFEIYTDSLYCRLGVVITHDGESLAFLLRKINTPEKEIPFH
jgi:hypothetical protein